LATDGKPVQNINLTEARDIADATAVSAAISVLVHDTASCPTSTSKNRQACACSSRYDLKKLKSAYAVAVAKHPGWNEVDAVVAYLDAANGKSVTLNFPGVKRQLDGCFQHRQ
jgi:hypothetical protein